MADIEGAIEGYDFEEMVDSIASWTNRGLREAVKSELMEAFREGYRSCMADHGKAAQSKEAKRVQSRD
jgi:hypothetical protein